MDPQNVLNQAERYGRALEGSPFNFDGIRVPFLYSYPFGHPRLVGEGWLRAGSGHAEADLPGS